MNRIYRLVWNAAKGLNQVASEHGRSRGKGKRGMKLRHLPICVLLISPTAFAAGALPTDGSIIAGSGTMASDGTAMMIVQSTQKMAIDWQSFSIGSGNRVQFVQPSADAVALNRVLGADASLIQGALSANGQVFLLNPNGVLFSPTAQVNAGALVASTLKLRNEDFLAGRYAFEGNSSNAVINQGRIAAAPGGVGGGVALIAAKVSNTGSIDAQRGSVLLGAGSQVLLDFGGPVKLQIAQGAVDALIENGGAIRADGGTVLMTAKAAGNLASTVINHTGLVQAQTLATGEKGTILLLGDMAHGRIDVGGTLDARAMVQGDGGFIETSGAEVTTRDGMAVNAGAVQGKGGLWLVDPYDYTIGTTAATNIGAALNTGTSVTITTQTSNASYGGGASGNGDITVASAITKSIGGDATLTLRADRSIIINQDISSTSGKLNIVLSAANAGGATRGGVDVQGHLKSNGGDILIGGALGSASHGIGFATNLGNTNAAVVIGQGKSVLSTGGNITINGKSTIGSSSGNFSGVTGGVFVKSGATIVSGNGNLYVTGESTGGTRTFGLAFEGNSGTVTTMGTSPNAGHMMINGVNSTSGGTASALDDGAVGMVSYGNRERIVFQGPSVASWLVFVNGVAQLSGYTQTPQLSSCSISYPNCGTMVVPGSNNSYLYATYNAVNMSTNPLYVTQTGHGSKVYDGNTSTSGLSFMTLGGPNGFAVSSLSPAPLFTTASKNVGTYESLIADPANPGTYTSGGTSYAVGYFNTGSFSITPKALTPIASDKVYDGNTVAAVTATGLISGDNVTLSGTGTFGSKDVGTYNNVGISGIQLSGTDAGNYTLSGNSVSNATASILQRTVTLSASKVYDGQASFSTGVSLGNLVDGEDLQFSGAVANSAHAGSASYLSSLTLADGNNGLAANYTLPSMSAASAANTASITPKTLTTALANSSVTKVYDGTTTAPAGFSPLWNITGFINGDTAAGISGTAAYDSKHVASASKVTVSGMTLGAITGSNGSLTSDYQLDVGSRFVAATITPKALTTSLANSNVTKVYDGTDAAPAGFAPGWNIADFISGDTAASISGTAAYDSKHVASASKVTVSGMTLSAITGSNSSQVTDYALDASSRDANASITPKSVTATLTNTNVSKTEDGNTSAPNGFVPLWSVAGLLNGDGGLDISHGSAAFNNSQAGAATRVTLAGLGISGVINSSHGSLANDYALSSSSAYVLASITPGATPRPAAVVPAQYTAVAATLLPPATGELTYVPAAAGQMSYVRASAGNPAAPGASPVGEKAAEQGGEQAGAPTGSSLAVINRQRKLASHNATLGASIKALDVIVISDGISLPDNATPPLAGK